MARALDHLMNEVLIKLEVASSVQGTNFESEPTSHGKPEDREPRWEFAPHVHFRARYRSASTDEQRREVIGGALEELRELRYSKQPKIDTQTKEGRLKIGTDPRPVSVLAYVYGYSERHIHRLRAEARRLSVRR
jgi:hypothetical protein